MGEIAIFLRRWLQPVDDAIDPAAIAVTVLLGEFGHPLPAHMDSQPNGHATVGLFSTSETISRHTSSPSARLRQRTLPPLRLAQEFAGPITK